MANKDRPLRASEICRLFDISKPTLYKWERDGKIPKTERDWRGWRLYTEYHIQEIKKNIQTFKKQTTDKGAVE